MINSRDSLCDYNPYKKDLVELPFDINQIVELKDNPNVIARVKQYRIIDVCGLKLIAGLNFSTDFQDEKVDIELDAVELEEKFQKSHDILLIPGKLENSRGFLMEYISFNKKAECGKNEDCRVLKRTIDKY